jgi:hypothetical protein
MRLTRDLKYKTELKHVSHLSNVFFSILWSCHIGDHPQGDLIMFGYRLVTKIKIY